ncbi:SpoIIE family protein phosphatase [Peterkaempfera bronchialis]|uniref:protein-serine/threonine phosphatase n=1 Tax=Peterkaempfera bronchialis TaxID=2126346 RepID=A0A345SRV5_9ACTN|nr:SpoIIE family protein phosphatase [Peterkaempfera bronchialis]AXI76460.1 PAS domain S-box protein [Peterkaempfera bronchialis]
MDERATESGTELPAPWPAGPDASLALNRMGSFDWEVDTGRIHLDEPALKVYGVASDEYHADPTVLAARMPAEERSGVQARISQAFKDGSTAYGFYFRVLRPDGGRRWLHAQGHIHRGPDGLPRRVIGILRDATEELEQAAERLSVERERDRQTSVVEGTTAALANAITVQDVTAVLSDPDGLGRLGAASLVLGVVEGGRIQVIAEGREGTLVPELEWSRIEDDYPLSEVVRTTAPVFLTSADEFAKRYPHLWPHISPLGVSAAAYLPLVAQSRAIGGLGLLYRDKDAFTAEERNLLVALSSGIAQSLQRAVLFDQEHDLAKGLQNAMLPRSLPQVPGVAVAARYRSARLGRDIGGDWYDAVPLPGGRVGVMVGDVQGHDTHAAAVMGQLRIALRAYAAEGHSPATVMARASVFLCELDTERFATCVYADVDPADGAVRVVRAGHIAPMLRHTDGWCRQVPGPVGLPLGLSAQFGDLEYPVTAFELAPGESLLLCSDGLVEKPGGDLDDGMDLLGRVVHQGPGDLEKLADRLCEVMTEQTGGEDDMALLLLSREEGTAAEQARFLHQYIAPGDPQALIAARHLIREAARAWGVPERSDEIELVADELVTNALRHTDGGALLSLRLLTGPHRRLRVEVQDRSSALPRRREPGWEATSGRGMLLVDRVADVWGVDPRGTGKCVWSEFVVGRDAED